MMHLYYGDPSERFSDALARTLLDNGADMLEIGIPSTRPVGDGEVLQRACNRAISAGMTPQGVFDGIKKLRRDGYRQPVYVMSYASEVKKIGIEAFVQAVHVVGGQGVIIPDMMRSLQTKLRTMGRVHDIRVIRFARPEDSDSSIRMMASEEVPGKAYDFIYCIGVSGMTGVRKQIYDQTFRHIRRVKRLTRDRVLVGFGISKPEQVQKIIAAGADGVIIGSAVATIYEKYEKNLGSPRKALEDIAAFTKMIKQSTIRRLL